MTGRNPLMALARWWNRRQEAPPASAAPPPAEPAAPAGLVLACAGCGRTYAIGRDAILVTLDLALQQFKAVVRVGAGGSPSSGPPDLVEAAETVRAEHRAAALAQAEETARPVIAALKEGQARRWRCNRCQQVNDYPAFAPPVKAAVQPAAVALMECPPFAGKGRCSDDACPCSDTAIPPAKGYLFLSEELCDFRRDCLARDVAEAKWRRMAEGADPLEQLQLMVKKILFPTLVCEQGARQRGLDLEVAAADYDLWVRTSKVPCRPTPRAAR